MTPRLRVAAAGVALAAGVGVLGGCTGSVDGDPQAPTQTGTSGPSTAPRETVPAPGSSLPVPPTQTPPPGSGVPIPIPTDPVPDA